MDAQDGRDAQTSQCFTSAPLQAHSLTTINVTPVPLIVLGWISKKIPETNDHRAGPLADGVSFPFS